MPIATHHRRVDEVLELVGEKRRMRISALFSLLRVAFCPSYQAFLAKCELLEEFLAVVRPGDPVVILSQADYDRLTA